MLGINFHSKRTRRAILFFTYGVMTVTTIVISAIVLFLALGYRFDNNSGSFYQSGLIQFRSFPDDANVIIDGKQQTIRTPSKLNVAAGEHDIVMRRDGYRDWNKRISIDEGQLLWLNYVRFIPNNITTTTVREFDAIADSLASPNRRWIVLQPNTAQPGLVFADIRDEENPTFKTVAIPDTAYTKQDGATGTFELVEWNLGGRFLLIKHTVNNVQEFIRFDRENPSEAINVTAKLGAVSKVQFAGDNGDIVYALIGNELKRASVTVNESSSLATNVTNFVVYRGDTVGVVSTKDNVQEVSLIKDNDVTAVKTYPSTGPLLIAVNNYFNQDYIAVSQGNRVELIRDPANAPNTAESVHEVITTEQPAEWLYFSNNGRMIVAQHQATFTTFDLELNKKTGHTFTTSQRVTEPFKWLDDYYLWTDLDGQLRIIEFDGANERQITTVAQGQTVTLSDNAELLFSVGRNNASQRATLQQSRLVLDE
ncbi:hypothetical protein CYG49_02180 [Candidatus Saccharibacteria bacterium]|nr:MAG: hypothetical protein CYG49_02180 [Candidatus Saccharibacteria bacterium]